MKGLAFLKIGHRNKIQKSWRICINDKTEVNFYSKNSCSGIAQSQSRIVQ